MDVRRLGTAVAMLAIPTLVLAGPLAAVLAVRPAVDRPTKTLAEQTVSVHLDAAPPGVDIHVSPTSASLLAAAGILRSRAAITAATAQVTTPPGSPTTLGLAQHVAPSCTGTGSDGDRVQVAYVTQVGATDRYATVLPALRSYVADVDDVMAVSSAETGGGRRVGWVTDASCAPVVLHVVLPVGSLGSSSDSDGGFNATISAMKLAGYSGVGRKYLMFVEATNLCGIAQVYPDSTKSNNNNDGRFPMYARVDSGCWTSSFHSVAAHELMHTLGSVQSDSPHPSAAGHCVDESDVMCYADGPGVVIENVCPPSHEQLYDCNHDDYFSTNTPTGNYLATHWNTADSPFLDTVPVLGPPLTLAVNAPVRGAFGATWSFAVAGPAPGSASYVWAVNPTSCSVVAAGNAATARCRGFGSSSVTVTVYRTASGVTTWGAATAPLFAATSSGGTGIRHNPLPPGH